MRDEIATTQLTIAKTRLTNKNFLENLSPHTPTLSYESIAGCDEVGRGALAGPVVAGAVVLSPAFYLTPLRHHLRDSKKLSEPKRLAIAQRLWQASCGERPLLWFQLGTASPLEVDRLNIHKATLLAMHRALRHLPLRPHEIWVDGRDVLNTRSHALTKGDLCHPAIQAAALMAKVSRDLWMTFLHHTSPHYAFKNHKGYGTSEHLKALKAFGPSVYHRQTFLKSLKSNVTFVTQRHAQKSS